MEGDTLHLALVVGSYVVAILAILICLWFRHAEAKNRPQGLYLKAMIQKVVSRKDDNKLELKFYLYGKTVRCSAFVSDKELRSIKQDKDYFIVYDPDTKSCVFDPGATYRKWQTISVVISVIAVSFGTLLMIADLITSM